MTFRITPGCPGIVIDAIEETLADGTEISSGFIFLDNLSQLELLRAHIDAYIANHNQIPTDR